MKKIIFQCVTPDIAEQLNFIGFFSQKNQKKTELLPVRFSARSEEALIQNMDDWLGMAMDRSLPDSVKSLEGALDDQLRNFLLMIGL